MSVYGIIPARMASTRFPNKPMAKIKGMPMIGHVYHRSKLAANLDDVWVATCDQEICDYIESIGGNAVMTADTHERASDRIAEALHKIEAITGQRVDIAAMIQGDEPMLEPAMLDELVQPAIDDGNLNVVNLMSRICDSEEYANPNLVKVVTDREGNALYFSREPIPSRKKYDGEMTVWKQLGLILFRREALLSYATMEPTPLEIIESVDMNRYLEHGTKIRMVGTSHETAAVDTPDDLSLVERLMADDHHIHKYL